jgi:hypothetical protein
MNSRTKLSEERKKKRRKEKALRKDKGEREKKRPDSTKFLSINQPLLLLLKFKLFY